jgi:GNAT superfamily N-acetyltransferase
MPGAGSLLCNEGSRKVETLRTSTLSGAKLTAVLPDLTRLRIEVFRDFPYLYDGSAEAEESYLSALSRSKDCMIAAAEDSGRIVGCATGSALIGHHDEFAAPFRETGYDPSQIFYCGESVLLPAYRGRGLGHKFFDLREAHAVGCGYRYAAFCAVIRPETHALRPAGYSPLDVFWEKRGYRKAPGIIAMFSWKEVGQASESEHAMQFWIRELV